MINEISRMYTKILIRDRKCKRCVETNGFKIKSSPIYKKFACMYYFVHIKCKMITIKGKNVLKTDDGKI